MNEATKQAILHNAELLRITFNTLQHLIKERGQQKNGYSDAFVYASAAKGVYERWETEVRKVQFSSDFPIEKIRTDFAPPAPLPFPDPKEVAEQVRNSRFYKEMVSPRLTK